jgi:preprotein translocase subunit SecG
MLSFQREQQIADLTQKGAENTTGQDGPDQPYLTVAARGSNVRRTTQLLAVLFIIGLLGIVFMIKKSNPASASAQDTDDAAQTRIEKALSRLTGIKAELFGRMDEIVNKFYEFSNVQQVDVDELTKNPFMHDTLWPGASGGPQETEYDTEMLRQQRVKKQADQMQLLSIMHATQGKCCMIDDKILYEGDSIKGFRLGQIGDNFVRLLWEEPGSEKIEIMLELTK